MGHKVYFLFAKDKNGNLVDVYQAELDSESEYFCPYCGVPVFINNVKKNEVRRYRYLFQHSKLVNDEADKCQGLFLDEAIKAITSELLRDGASLYVNSWLAEGIRELPDLIFKPADTSMFKNEYIGAQKVGLKWISKKGKSMGILFVDHEEVIINKNYSVGDAQAFIAEINLAILKSHLRLKIKQGLDGGLKVAIKELLTNNNNFCRWIYWEGKPSSYQISPAQIRVINRYGYDSYINITSLTHSGYYEGDFSRQFNSNQNKKLVLKLTKRQFNYKIKEMTYQFCFEYNDRSDTFYIVIYEKESILLDYVLNSVPINDCENNQIKGLCLKLINLYESAMAGFCIK